jgi:molybdenum cofactor sulfurtransferase
MSLEKVRDYEPSYPPSLSMRSASRASAGRVSQVSLMHSIPHAIRIPPTEYNPPALLIPNSKSITCSRKAESWTDNTTTMPSSALAHKVQHEPPRSSSKHSAFVSSDYTNRDRSLENKTGKHTTAAEAEAEFREMEVTFTAANRNGQNPSNSVKARRFGRSVVNLLRQKSNYFLADNANTCNPADK